MRSEGMERRLRFGVIGVRNEGKWSNGAHGVEEEEVQRVAPFSLERRIFQIFFFIIFSFIDNISANTDIVVSPFPLCELDCLASNDVRLCHVPSTIDR